MKIITNELIKEYEEYLLEEEKARAITTASVFVLWRYAKSNNNAIM